MKKLLVVLFALMLAGCKSENALLLVEMDMWGGNEDDPDEILVNLYVHNYGYAAAEDIKLKCLLINTENDEVTTIEADVGDVAATSVEPKFVQTNNPGLGDINKYKMQCYGIECNGCEFLEDRIPEIVDGRVG
jgi:hypothetical protein